MKLGTIKMDYEKKLSAAAGALELSETEPAKERSEKESIQKKGWRSGAYTVPGNLKDRKTRVWVR